MHEDPLYRAQAAKSNCCAGTGEKLAVKNTAAVCNRGLFLIECRSHTPLPPPHDRRASRPDAATMSLERKILATLNARGYRPVSRAVLARDLNVTKRRMEEFRQVLDALIASGRARETAGGLLRPSAQSGFIRGTIKRSASGSGYLIVSRQVGQPKVPDVFISERDMSDAHTGDVVLAQIVRAGHGPRANPIGRVVEVQERATRSFVGLYFERDHEGWVQVDGNTLNEPIQVGDPGAKGALPGDKVVFEMVRFPSHLRGGEGVITKVLGPRGQPGVDTLSIIHEFALPDEHPPEVVAEAGRQAEEFDEANLGGRRDLTAETIITIDPVDARDFDDAISLTVDERGHWHLGVHIADVAHFVRPGSRLDQEAYRRGTSVYLPDRVLPMLPEVISNNLASLQQGKVRYAVSALLEFTPEGIPVGAQFARSAIKVARRFAYEEIMPIVRHPERPAAHVTASVRALLFRMHDLAMRLRARRFAAGALELDLPEIKIDFDRAGKVKGAHLAPHDESHQIIEEFMLAANIAVATALADRGVPYLRRVHEDPEFEKLRALAEFATSLGYPLKRFQSRLDLQRLLDRVRDTPHRQALNYALLRSLKQAHYSPEEIGHYALAAQHYCHFTSPIRRYPDLEVHRLVGKLIDGTLHEAVPGESELFAKGEHCSRTERRAEQAERELVKVKLLTYMADRVGEEFFAVITGVQDFGFFCQVVDVPAEGLVHVSSLGDDYYEFDRAGNALAGRQRGGRYQLGDTVRVVVARVDVDRRQLDFRLAGAQGKRPAPGARRQEAGHARRAGRTGRRETR